MDPPFSSQRIHPGKEGRSGSSHDLAPRLAGRLQRMDLHASANSRSRRPMPSPPPRRLDEVVRVRLRGSWISIDPTEGLPPTSGKQIRSTTEEEVPSKEIPNSRQGDCPRIGRSSGPSPSKPTPEATATAARQVPSSMESYEEPLGQDWDLALKKFDPLDDADIFVDERNVHGTSMDTADR